VHVPRSLQERAYKVERELRALSFELNRSATPAELAARCESSVEEVLEALDAARAYSTLSLDSSGDDDKSPREWRVGAEDRGYRLVEEASAVRAALNALPTRERQILALRFGADLTQAQIGERIGMSQMHVSRLLHRALDRAGAIATAKL
jgi:RNA polymerase sigma-B factor